jgi:hypothetical protein
VQKYDAASIVADRLVLTAEPPARFATAMRQLALTIDGGVV